MAINLTPGSLGGDFGNILQGRHHVGYQRAAPEFEINLALAVDGLRGPPVSGGDDGGNRLQKHPPWLCWRALAERLGAERADPRPRA